MRLKAQRLNQLETNANFKKRLDFFQGIEKMPTLYHKLREEKKESTPQTNLGNLYFLTKKILQFSMFLMF